jgi:hypothetical protein
MVCAISKAIAPFYRNPAAAAVLIPEVPAYQGSVFSPFEFWR